MNVQKAARRLGVILTRSRFESEMNDELQFHLEMQIEQFVRSGCSPQEARRRALVAIGGLEKTREDCREAVGIRWMHDFVQDFRYAIRMLIRNPGFTVIAVLTLALGIGANTAVFSVVNGIVLQPLPFSEPDRIVMVWQQNLETGFEQEQVAAPDYLDWIERNTTFESFGAIINQGAGSRNFMLQTGDDVSRIRGRFVTSGMFDVLGVPAFIGQTLQPEDDLPDGACRAVLSHSLWKEVYGADPNVLGQSLDVGKRSPFEIVGVMPPGFRFPQDADVWLSFPGVRDANYLRRMFEHPNSRHSHNFWVIGRLKPGVTAADADGDLSAIQRQIHDDPSTRRGWKLASDVVVTPIIDQLNGEETEPALMLLLGAVAFVLLIACANVANLLLSRATSRRKEMAIRASLGAGRLRVIRQLLTESILLSLLGAGLGILFAIWGIDLLELIRTDSTYLGVKEFRFDRFDDVGVDLRVLGFTIGVSLITGILFGLIPAIQASRLNVNAALKEEGRSDTPGTAVQFFRNSLLVSEVALALILVVGAGVALQGFSRLINVDIGMQVDNVIRAEFDMDVAQNVYGMDGHAAYDELTRRLKAVPGVTNVAACGELPLVRSGWNDTFRVVRAGSDDGADEAELPRCDVRCMSPGVFETLGVPIIEGREFTEEDDGSVPSVTIINQALAEKYFPDENPIGQTIQMRGWANHAKIIVGVVGSVRNYSVDSAEQVELYFPFKQSFLAGSEVGPVMLIRVQGDPEEMISTLHAAVDGTEPGEDVLIRYRHLDRILDMSASAERFQTTLLGCFAGVALVLAIVGVYGVMSYSTAQRIQEIGIRMALGALPGRILKSIVGRGVILCLAGIGIGLVASVVLGQVLASLFYGVEPSDPITLAAVSILILVVGAAASFIPAWRAVKVDPMTALRYE